MQHETASMDKASHFVGRLPRAALAGLLAAFCMLLGGCFMTPGKFQSTLAFGDDNQFSFVYEGEIYIHALSQLAIHNTATEDFTSEECFDDASIEPRPCAPAEINDQRAQWEAKADERAAMAEMEAEQLASLMGVTDTSDPEQRAEFVEALLRQEGFESVVDKGDGLFDISYQIEGTLTHDFLFPMIDAFPTATPFVQILRRKDGSVRIQAPAFGKSDSGNTGMGPLGGLAAMGMASGALSGEKAATGMPKFPQAEGTFRIELGNNAQILTNNTMEGPEATANGRALVWSIDARTDNTPSALIGFPTIPVITPVLPPEATY